MHAPQFIYIVLVALNVGIDLAKDGEPKKGNYNAIGSLIASALIMALLWWGGFFS